MIPSAYRNALLAVVLIVLSAALAAMISTPSPVGWREFNEAMERIYQRIDNIERELQHKLQTEIVTR